MSRRLPVLCARQAFERLITPLRATARAHGYALAVHGSLARDIDLIAVPWGHAPSSAHVLTEAIRATAEDITGYTAFIKNDPKADPHDFTRRGPEPKFHGRLAWSIYVKPCHPGGYETYIDLSVMPAYDNAIERYHDALAALVPQEVNA